MATYALTIAGVTKTLYTGFRISETANGRNRMDLRMISTDGSYLPAKYAEVILTEDGTRIFGGQIMEVVETGLNDEPVTAVDYRITALDFNMLADRRYIGIPIVSGTLKSHLEIVVPYIPGVTLDPSQADGPTIPDTAFSGWRISDVLDQLTVLSGGWLWEVDYNKVARMFEPGTSSAPFDIAVGDGNTKGDVSTSPVSSDYYNKVIVFGDGYNAVAEDAAGIAAYNYIELLVKAPDANSQALVDSLAAEYLARSLPIVKKVQYVTHQPGIHPGMTQGINIPARHITNTCLVLDVEVNNRQGTSVLERKVTAIEGLVYRTGWREAIRGGSGGAITTSGGGSGSPFVRVAYPLSEGTAVESSVPTWVPASNFQIQLNTVSRGTTSATVYVRLRSYNSGVSVQARLFNVSLNTACAGVSAVITSTTFSTPPTTFTATLDAGSDYYRLELLPSHANEPVEGVGYVE